MVNIGRSRIDVAEISLPARRNRARSTLRNDLRWAVTILVALLDDEGVYV